MTKAVQLIAKERDRQINKLKWDSKHDDECHRSGELAMAGCCYAAPEKIYIQRQNRGLHFVDPWPFGQYYRGEWSNRGWKPKSESRIDDLTKAGALIAAEIDRLLREEKRDKRKTD